MIKYIKIFFWFDSFFLVFYKFNIFIFNFSLNHRFIIIYNLEVKNFLNLDFNYFFKRNFFTITLNFMIHSIFMIYFIFMIMIKIILFY